MNYKDKKRKYELTILTKPDVEQDYIKTLHNNLAKYDRNVRLTEIREEKKLAFNIPQGNKMYEKAHYLYFDLSLTSSQANKLSCELNIEMPILRYLLVVARS